MLVKDSSSHLSKVSSATTSPTSGFIKTEVNSNFTIKHNDSSSGENKETI